MHFVDFEKAFDSVDRESLWNIMTSYGIPGKMVGAKADLYEGFECTVVDGSVTSDWCMIRSRLKQGFGDVWISIPTVLGLGHKEGNSRQEKRDKSGISHHCWRTLISQMTPHYCHLCSMTCIKRLGDWRRKQPEEDLNLMRESARH